MKRLFSYYGRVLKHKYYFWKIGKDLGVSLASRIVHNSDLLNPKYAVRMSKILYDKSGKLTDTNYYLSNPEYLELVKTHNSKSRSTIEYWRMNSLSVIPKKYIQEFIADKFADCELNWNKCLMSIRDVLFYESTAENSYSTQVYKVFEDYSNIKRN